MSVAIFAYHGLENSKNNIERLFWHFTLCDAFKNL